MSNLKQIEDEHIREGLAVSLTNMKDELIGQIDGLTQKQLRRALKSTVEYLAERKVSTPESALQDRELKYIGGLSALVESGFAFQQYVIKELYEEQQKQEQEND